MLPGRSAQAEEDSIRTAIEHITTHRISLWSNAYKSQREDMERIGGSPEDLRAWLQLSKVCEAECVAAMRRQRARQLETLEEYDGEHPG